MGEEQEEDERWAWLQLVPVGAGDAQGALLKGAGHDAAIHRVHCHRGKVGVLKVDESKAARDVRDLVLDDLRGQIRRAEGCQRG